MKFLFLLLILLVNIQGVTDNQVNFNVINELLNSGSEKEGLQKIDDMVEIYYASLTQSDVLRKLKTKNNLHAYYSYFFIKLLKMNMHAQIPFDDRIYNFYRYYVIAAFWHGYYQQIDDITKYMQKHLKMQKNLSAINKKMFYDFFELINGLYLICIGDTSGYARLSQLQPLSKKLKLEVKFMTQRESPFTKNINKLMKAMNMHKEEFGSVKKHEQINIFFDINGSKISKTTINE